MCFSSSYRRSAEVIAGRFINVNHSWPTTARPNWVLLSNWVTATKGPLAHSLTAQHSSDEYIGLLPFSTAAGLTDGGAGPFFGLVPSCFLDNSFHCLLTIRPFRRPIGSHSGLETQVRGRQSEARVSQWLHVAWCLQWDPCGIAVAFEKPELLSRIRPAIRYACDRPTDALPSARLPLCAPTPFPTAQLRRPRALVRLEVQCGQLQSEKWQ